jgi:CheY-like chemotaxis protein
MKKARKVLVVEDNLVNRALVTRFLMREGYEVIFAENGLRGVELAGAEKPDIILMDIDLPEMDGLEATRRIKADPATSDIPVLALTAGALEGDVAKAAQAGCDAFAAKPVLYANLMQKVNGIVEDRRHRVLSEADEDPRSAPRGGRLIPGPPT